MRKKRLPNPPSEAVLLYKAFYICYTVAMKYNYKALYEKNAAFLEKRPMFKRCLKYVTPLLSAFFFGAYVFLWIYGIFVKDLATMDYVKLFTLAATAYLLVVVLRLAVARPRPYSEKGANIKPLLKRKGSETDSFPSRHVTCAAVISMLVLSHFTAVGVLMLGLTAFLSYARFATGMHYPSDIFGGLALGIAVGVFAWIW